MSFSPKKKRFFLRKNEIISPIFIHLRSRCLDFHWVKNTQKCQKLAKNLTMFYPISSVGGSMVQNEEDISPYATFHLLGMREENKNGGNPNPQNQFKTLQPNQSGPGTMMGGPPPGMVQQTGPMGGTQTGPNTPAHQRQIQTMNVSIINT